MQTQKSKSSRARTLFFFDDNTKAASGAREGDGRQDQDYKSSSDSDKVATGQQQSNNDSGDMNTGHNMTSGNSVKQGGQAARPPSPMKDNRRSSLSNIRPSAILSKDRQQAFRDLSASMRSNIDASSNSVLTSAYSSGLPSPNMVKLVIRHRKNRRPAPLSAAALLAERGNASTAFLFRRMPPEWHQLSVPPLLRTMKRTGKYKDLQLHFHSTTRLRVLRIRGGSRGRKGDY
eukprot:gb/GEZN01012540.1/.p1 GENE.gb/GEZN01012540.1/~~gb/GEZN01012540.1/.p1  ORF type:complete len:232 (-),score=17.88 gb/GEZN01012540.1/:336-1031(-)